MENNKWPREHGSVKITNPILSAEVPHKFLAIFGIIWVLFLLLAIFTASKTFDLFGYTFAAVVIGYPVTYIFNDVFTEVYGYRVSRKMIWSGFLVVLTISTLAYLYSYIPSSSQMDPLTNEAFNAIFRVSPLVAIVTLLGFFVGEFTNSTTLAKMKIIFMGKYDGLRYVTSTFLGQVADNTVAVLCFVYVVGLFDKSITTELILTSVIFCTVWEMLALPITRRVIKWIKEKEGIDTYDVGTNFNPFKLG